jgi:hypothetical protein
MTADLLSLSEFPLGNFNGDETLGFVLCLPPGTRYAVPNFLNCSKTIAPGIP